MLPGRGEDHESVLGMCQVDFGQCAVQLLGDLATGLPGDSGIGLKLFLRSGHEIAQPDGILSVVRFATVRGHQDRNCRIGTLLTQLGQGSRAECGAHVNPFQACRHINR